VSTQRHAAARAPRSAKEQPATLPQLKELVGQIHGGLIGRDYMQDFLKHRLIRPDEVAPASLPVLENQLLREVEDIVQEHYPDKSMEIMELVAPFCDPALDLEFQPEKNRLGKTRLAQIGDELFWLTVKDVKVVTISGGTHLMSDRDLVGDEIKFRDLAHMSELVEQMFAKEFETYKHLDSEFDSAANKIAVTISDRVRSAMYSTGAMRYRLIQDRVQTAVTSSIYEALLKSIVLLGRGDRVRANKILPFLARQRSGNPIVCYHDKIAYLLVAPS
jgi:hypothetical protein